MTELCDEHYSRPEDREECYGRFHAPRRGRIPPYPDLYLIHVRFDLNEDEGVFSQLSTIATDLQLPRKEVNLVIDSVGPMLKKSKEFQRLLSDLDAETAVN